MEYTTFSYLNVTSGVSRSIPFEIGPYGVIMKVGKQSEVLIPWHRVLEVETIRTDDAEAELE